MGQTSPAAAIRRLRWRLAGWVAPRPIMASPGEGDGVWVVIRRGGLLAAVKADSFKGKFTNGIGGRMRFIGTVKASNPLYDPQSRTAIQQRAVVAGS